MQKELELMKNPPTDDPTKKNKTEKTLQELSDMDMNKASIIMYLQS